jgi:hypothetical protein
MYICAGPGFAVQSVARVRLYNSRLGKWNYAPTPDPERKIRGIIEECKTLK